jgi:hypothetical protein
VGKIKEKREERKRERDKGRERQRMTKNNKTYGKEWFSVSAAEPKWPRTALYSTSAGICSRHTCSAYAEPISIERAMFPFIANDMAFYTLPPRIKK